MLQTSSNGLIVPLKIRDGRFFPEDISDLQILDCNDFYRVGKGVEGTELYVKFQDKLLKWVEDVAKVINNAPDWHREWLTDEWLEIPYYHLKVDSNMNISQPRL